LITLATSADRRSLIGAFMASPSRVAVLVLGDAEPRRQRGKV
jgi:hypothetical protein